MDKYKNAHMELWKAIRKGVFEKHKVKCERCGSDEWLQYHHSDYDKPYEVEILCSSCHRKEHKAECNFKKAYKKMPRNKYGRFGKKSLGKIACINCGKLVTKQNPKQKYCKKCNKALNIGHKAHGTR